MNLLFKTFVFLVCCVSFDAMAQVSKSSPMTFVKGNLKTEYIAPVKILWKNAVGGAVIKNEECLLKKGRGQAGVVNEEICEMQNSDSTRCSLLLDFGRELQGGLRIVTGMSKTRDAKVRIRYGESVSEAMSDIGECGASNDHAMRDFVVTLPWVGRFDTSMSGFRFARIDLLGVSSHIKIKEINAAFTYSDLPYVGSFSCSDPLLDSIWTTGAYTVHLNMQDYLWDGIKRDRLVWAGDMYPEVMTAEAVFGTTDIVRRSLDFNRDMYPATKWMNNISSYSMWWVLCHYQIFMHGGDMEYLNEQRPYMTQLLTRLVSMVGDDGKIKFDGRCFLDWPSSTNPVGVKAGMHGLMLMTMSYGTEIAKLYGDSALKEKCLSAAERLKKYIPDCNGSKQGASLMSLAGLTDPVETNERYVSANGVNGFSTFYGYFMLEAMAKAGDYDRAMEFIKKYWGGMLELGATTFWEDFDIKWLDRAGRIDQMPDSAHVDVHRTYGDYCYKGLRHSLCHGWASGPTAWLTAHVLGIKIVKSGCREIVLDPHLGSLSWAKGSFPTPYGVLTVEHKKTGTGKLVTKYNAPKGVKVVCASR